MTRGKHWYGDSYGPTGAGLIAAALVVVLVVAAGIIGWTVWRNHYKETRGLEDASIGRTNTGPADVITFPNQFSNVARKCDGPNMVYTGSHTDQGAPAIFVVANDPRCDD